MKQRYSGIILVLFAFFIARSEPFIDHAILG